MSECKLPRLLDSELKTARILHPVEYSPTLRLTGVSEATTTLGAGDDAPPMHSLIECWTPDGEAGIFRVTNIAQTVLQETQLTLRHARDLFADATFRAQEDVDLTMAQYLQRIIGYQTARIRGVAPWQLGTVACTTQVKRTMNYERLSALLDAIEADETDYCFAYDFTTWPWTISLVEKSSAVTAEARVTRNMTSCTVTVDDSDLCNRLRVSASRVTTGAKGKKTQDTVYRDYEDLVSQGRWGVVERVADIEVHEDVKAGEHAEIDAFAARYFAERAQPSVQIEIDGLDLSRATGETWDRPKLGQKCRAHVPQAEGWLDERVVSITWPDPLSEPNRVRYSLANTLPKVSESLAKTAKAAARAGRGAAKAAKDAELANSWSMIVSDMEEAVNGVGIQTLWETGIVIDAHDGARIYSLMEGLNALNAEVKVNHAGVSSVVSGITAGAFDPEHPYVKGDCVVYGDKIYEFTAAHTGAWTGSDARQVTNMASTVSQQSGSIETIVSKTGINSLGQSETLYSKITQTATQISAKVDKTDVTITGDGVSITGIGSLDISGLKTRVGDLEADYVSANAIATNGITVKSLTVDNGGANLGNANVYYNGTSLGLMYVGLQVVSAGNDSYKLQGKRPGSSAWADIPNTTFSRATSLTGAWASGVYTVTASPQGETDLTSLSGSGHWGDADNDEIPTTYYLALKATRNGEQTLYDTGYSYEVPVAAKLTTATVAPGSTVTAGSGTYANYIGFTSVTASGSPSATPLNITPSTAEQTFSAGPYNPVKVYKLSSISGSRSITRDGTYTYKVMYENADGDDVAVAGLSASVTVSTYQNSATLYKQTYTTSGYADKILYRKKSDGTFTSAINTNNVTVYTSSTNNIGSSVHW